ncbi:MAG: DUF1800 domain-containing protein [Chloroflexi bacterium]|nr:DUF1800 domain-containing protein [Chloroflexota bacterium]MDA1228067.1 DUF1800 domain-containing protein [Chloroflexota bacterium]
MVVQTRREVELIAHLMRRAGFGATRDELQQYAAKGYDALLDHLLNPSEVKTIPDELIRRYHHEQSGMMGQQNPGAYWLYKMISTTAPLQEKMTLFWHTIFATGYPKITNGKVLNDQIRMFRHYGMGNFKTLLLELAKDPAMIVWLDNHDNHKGAINENFGRELLELFSLGVGNYTEEDIKEASRAFTGWTLGNKDYMALRAERDSIWPYGRIAWHFQFDADDHDDGEKNFLGNTGNFDGEDIVDLICQQESTARFIARHLYDFFVAEEPPVPQWPYNKPRDPEAIDILAQAYFDNDYDITAMLRALFTSDFFKSDANWFVRVKSPAELVAGVLRLTDEFDRPRREILDRALQMSFMGQFLINPPSVEGWHQGPEWIDTGTLVERLNFATGQLGDIGKPGVRRMISKVISTGDGIISPARLVEACLDVLGVVTVSDDTRETLENFAVQGGELHVSPENVDEAAQQRVAQMFQMVAASHEFQRS